MQILKSKPQPHHHHSEVMWSFKYTVLSIHSLLTHTKAFPEMHNANFQILSRKIYLRSDDMGAVWRFGSQLHSIDCALWPLFFCASVRARLYLYNFIIHSAHKALYANTRIASPHGLIYTHFFGETSYLCFFGGNKCAVCSLCMWLCHPIQQQSPEIDEVKFVLLALRCVWKTTEPEERKIYSEGP